MLETSIHLVVLDTIGLKVKILYHFIQEFMHNLNLILTTAWQSAHVEYFRLGWLDRYNQFKKPDFFNKPGFYALSQKSNQHWQNICGIRLKINGRGKLLR